jgi:hypothetical protein
MPELRLDVPQSVIDLINEKLRKINADPSRKPLSANDIGREALAVYNWAVDQTSEGLAVVSSDKSRAPVVQIATPNIPGRAPTK